MTYSKELLDRMSRRMQRHIELEIYRAVATPSFLAAHPHLPSPTAAASATTRDYMPYPYKREPHRCGPACKGRFNILDYA